MNLPAIQPFWCFRSLPWRSVLIGAISLFWAPFPLAKAGSDSAARLREAPVFAIGGIGVAGTMSDGERALRVVLRESDAAAQLEALLRSATPAGQLYALLGLRLHDRVAYKQALQDFHPPKVQVETIGGCMISHAPFQELLQRIESGDYDKALARPAW